MNAEIVSIGTELLLGEIVDTNSAHIARNLRDIGLNLFFTTTVGDNEERIVSALNMALDRADIVITTGGLGPTVDDVTRQAVAVATNRKLVFSQELLGQIAARFAQFGHRMSENNRQQAYIPEDAVPIENPVGTAPCFIVESERGVVISLPGVPREMKYLLDVTVLPYLRKRFNLTSIIKARVLRTAGIGESRIDEAIADLMKLTNPTVGLAAHIGQTDVRITAKADNETIADEMIAQVEAQVRERLGDYIYGVGKQKLELVLVEELKRTGMKISISETGFGNNLQTRVEQVEGGASVIAGVERFDTPEALCEALALDCTAAPEQIGEVAARHAQRQFNSPLSMAVIARSDVIIIGITTPDSTKTRAYRFGVNDSRPSTWASNWSMAMAWRWLKSQP
jgi:nicotinamide-nucleotide amidase